jgi:purine-binding chemotaxis protein CheW
MDTDADRISTRASSLRHEFDRSFAVARDLELAPVDDLLAIDLDGDPYLIRLGGIVGLFADRHVTPVPGPVSELLGVAGFRGSLIPVYDLRLLLGYAGGGNPRWLVLLDGKTPVGLAFEHFIGHLKLPRAALTACDQADAARRHIHEVASTADGIRPVIHLPSLLDLITRRSRVDTPPSRSAEP